MFTTMKPRYFLTDFAKKTWGIFTKWGLLLQMAHGTSPLKNSIWLANNPKLNWQLLPGKTTKSPESLQSSWSPTPGCARSKYLSTRTNSPSHSLPAIPRRWLTRCLARSYGSSKPICGLHGIGPWGFLENSSWLYGLLNFSRPGQQVPKHPHWASIADLISKLVYQVLKPTHPAIKKPNHKADSHLVLLTRCSLKLLGKPAVWFCFDNFEDEWFITFLHLIQLGSCR